MKIDTIFYLYKKTGDIKRKVNSFVGYWMFFVFFPSIVFLPVCNYYKFQKDVQCCYQKGEVLAKTKKVKVRPNWDVKKSYYVKVRVSEKVFNVRVPFSEWEIVKEGQPIDVLQKGKIVILFPKGIKLHKQTLLNRTGVVFLLVFLIYASIFFRRLKWK